MTIRVDILAHGNPGGILTESELHALVRAALAGSWPTPLTEGQLEAVGRWASDARLHAELLAGVLEGQFLIDARGETLLFGQNLARN